MIRKKKKGKVKENQLGWIEKPLTIGILSLSPCSGGMHFGIMLANYLTSKKRLKGAVIVSDKENFAGLQKIADVEENPMIQGVTFLFFDSDKIAEIMNEDFQFIIFIFHNREEIYWEEFLRCQNSFVVENFSEWKIENMSAFVQENRKLSGFGRWRFFYVFGPKDYVGWLGRSVGISIEKIPWNQDAFSVGRDSFSFLESLV